MRAPRCTIPMTSTTMTRTTVTTRSPKKRGRYADYDETSEDDVMAERIIRLAPPITAIACALIVALSLVYHFVLA